MKPCIVLSLEVNMPGKLRVCVAIKLEGTLLALP